MGVPRLCLSDSGVGSEDADGDPRVRGIVAHQLPVEYEFSLRAQTEPPRDRRTVTGRLLAQGLSCFGFAVVPGVRMTSTILPASRYLSISVSLKS
jgi:hypothetical protein